MKRSHLRHKEETTRVYLFLAHPTYIIYITKVYLFQITLEYFLFHIRFNRTIQKRNGYLGRRD